MGISVDLIKPEDTESLLAFELANRSWFETKVSPRGDQFYSYDGVSAHIDHFLELYYAKKRIPMVIRDHSGVICGRVNLKNIDLECGIGELGYRIAKSHLRMGIATIAVKRLIEFTRSEGYPTQIKAYVVTNNVGSQKVLEKSLFHRTGFIENFTILNGQSHDAFSI